MHLRAYTIFQFHYLVLSLWIAWSNGKIWTYASLESQYSIHGVSGFKMINIDALIRFLIDSCHFNTEKKHKIQCCMFLSQKIAKIFPIAMCRCTYLARNHKKKLYRKCAIELIAFIQSHHKLAISSLQKRRLNFIDCQLSSIKILSTANSWNLHSLRLSQQKM